MLVTRIIGTCPLCGREKAYGNVDVIGDSLLRGCRYCDYSTQLPLPPLKKSILYLDQFFLSEAFKDREPRFQEAAARISKAASNQLLAVPYSSVHEDESLLWSRGDELGEFIKTTSRGAKFKAEYDVERRQIWRAFGDWKNGRPASRSTDASDALERDIHKWDGYFFIDVARYPRDADAMREAKARSVKALVAIFDSWRISSASFDEDVAAEHLETARSYVRLYLDYFNRVGSGDLDALFNSSIQSEIVNSLMRSQPSDEPFEVRLKKCGTFLQSDNFRESPRQRLRSRIFATLKTMVRNGAFPNNEKAELKLSGFFEDVQHVATYAPYCDAIVVDAAMAELVTRTSVGLPADYGVKVFSMRKLPELFDWLDSLQTKMTADQQDALRHIHLTR